MISCISYFLFVFYFLLLFYFYELYVFIWYFSLYFMVSVLSKIKINLYVCYRKPLTTERIFGLIDRHASDLVDVFEKQFFNCSYLTWSRKEVPSDAFWFFVSYAHWLGRLISLSQSTWTQVWLPQWLTADGRNYRPCCQLRPVCQLSRCSWNNSRCRADLGMTVDDIRNNVMRVLRGWRIGRGCRPLKPASDDR